MWNPQDDRKTGLPAPTGQGVGTPAASPGGGTDALSSSGIFQAKISSAQGAIPVPGAKIILRRGGEVAAFLMTDESGLSRVISLPSPPEGNTLDPESGNRSADYTAYVSAEGLAPVSGLLVSMVGGGMSLLRIDLVPLPKGGA